jgi:hypothetical protein
MMSRACVVYARRSSDSEDRQALSLESQLEELRKFAAARGFEIAEELTESASAREPGRPVFNQLMSRIREGKVKGILVWRLDRLARNLVDAGPSSTNYSRGHLKRSSRLRALRAYRRCQVHGALQFGGASKHADDLSAAVKGGNHHVLEGARFLVPCRSGTSRLTNINR